MALGDGHEAAQARLRGEQIVIARIHPALIDVVADCHQMPGVVVEESVVDESEFADLLGQAFDAGDPLAGPLAGQFDQGAKLAQPDVFVRI